MAELFHTSVAQIRGSVDGNFYFTRAESLPVYKSLCFKQLLKIVVGTKQQKYFIRTQRVFYFNLQDFK